MLKRTISLLVIISTVVIVPQTLMAQALPVLPPPCRLDDAPCVRRQLLSEAHLNDALKDANQHLNDALKQQRQLYELEHDRREKLEIEAAQNGPHWYQAPGLWFGVGVGTAILGGLAFGLAAHR